MESSFVPAGHYYSPIPDRQEAQQAIEKAERAGPPLGIDLNPAAMVKFWDKLLPFMSDVHFPVHKSASHRYYYENPFYSYGDALVYAGILCKMLPQRLIEIGSGYSSAVALDVRDKFHLATQMTFIEPYPERLRSLLRPSDASETTIAQEKIQNVDLDQFSKLEVNDILFVDSSHVAKTGSDLCFILFEILPRLPHGVIVHFHDIFWPFEYSKHWAVTELRGWNECYFLRAFLAFNPAFEIMFFNDYFGKYFGEFAARTLPKFAKNPGGGLWLRRALE